MTGPQPQYLVAFNDTATTDPATITQIASPPGTLGAKGTWTDITPWVTGHSVDRGKQHEVAQFDAGQCQIELWNPDGRFSPFNLAGPYGGLVVTRKPVQVRAVWQGTTFYRFTGHVDRWEVDWGDQMLQTAVLHATDAFRIFNTAALNGNVYTNSVLLDQPAGFWTLSGRPSKIPLPFNDFGFPDLSGNGIPFDMGNTNSIDTGDFVVGVTGPFTSSPNTAITFTWTGGIGDGLASGGASGQVPFNTSAASIEFWMNSPNSGGVNQHMWTNGSVLGTANEIQLQGSTISAPGVAGTVSVADNSWHHIVWTWETALTGLQYPGNRSTVYIDGKLNNIAINPILNTFVTNHIWFGSSGTDGYTGSVANIAQYNYALNATQVAAHYRAGAQIFNQETTDARINAALSMVPWPAGARQIDPGTVNTQAVASFGNTTVLQHLQQIEATESGAIFMTADGRARFVNGANVWSAPQNYASQVVLGDHPGDIPFDPGPTVGLDDLDIYNDATATRTGGVQQEAVDQASIGAYGRQTWNPAASLYNTADSEVAAIVQRAVQKYAQPVVRIQQVTVNLLGGLTGDQVAALLALDVLNRVTVERTQPPGGQSPLVQASAVEHIAEKVDPNMWELTLALALVDPRVLPAPAASAAGPPAMPSPVDYVAGWSGWYGVWPAKDALLA